MKKKYHTDSIDNFFSRKKSSFRFIYNTTIEIILETIKKFPVPDSFEPIIVRKTYEKLFMDKTAGIHNNNDLSLYAELSCMEVCCRYVSSNIKSFSSYFDDQIRYTLNKTKTKEPLTAADIKFMEAVVFSEVSFDKKHCAEINRFFHPKASSTEWNFIVPPLKMTYIHL